MFLQLYEQSLLNSYVRDLKSTHSYNYELITNYFQNHHAQKAKSKAETKLKYFQYVTKDSHICRSI